MSALAALLPEMPTFLDDSTPDSGFALRRWTPAEYRRVAAVFGPEERLELAHGDIQTPDGRPRLFSCDEYYRLAEHDVFKPDERTELIYGKIITRLSPMGRPHSVCVAKTATALAAAFGAGFAIESQTAIQLGSGLEPQPDVIVLLGTSDDYADAPIASDIQLLVEVSDSTLRYDRGTKVRMYAAENVPDYWIVHLRGRTLEVRRQPENGEYLSLDVYQMGDSVAPLVAPDAPVSVPSLLPLVRPRAG